MIRINDRSVKLTPAEARASFMFERCLDEGDGIHAAIKRVRKAFWMYDLPQAFYDWLAFPSTKDES